MTPDELKAAKIALDAAKNTPIFHDAIQPVAKQVGTTLETVGKSVNALLLPIRGLVWGSERIGEYCHKRLEQKLKHVPHGKRAVPEPNVVGPAIESLKFTAQNPTLREMYMNLIATSMNADMTVDAHPAFVEMIRQLTSDEAKIIRAIADTKIRSIPCISVCGTFKDLSKPQELAFMPGPTPFQTYVENFTDIAEEAGCQFVGRVFAYVDNLSRLKIVQVFDDVSISTQNDSAYAGLKEHPHIKRIEKTIQERQQFVMMNLGQIRLTNLGEIFCRACFSSDDNEPLEDTSTEPA